MEAIRILAPEDAEVFRDMRLKGLLDSPESFGSTYEVEANRDIDFFRMRIHQASDSFVLGAFDQDGQLIGVVGFKQEHTIKLRHKGLIWGMYVMPGYRSQGVGRRLMEKAIELANQIDGLEQINLSVVTGNQGAKKLYESLGFLVYGIEKRALKHQGIYDDEELMTLWLY